MAPLSHLSPFHFENPPLPSTNNGLSDEYFSKRFSLSLSFSHKYQDHEEAYKNVVTMLSQFKLPKLNEETSEDWIFVKSLKGCSAQNPSDRDNLRKRLSQTCQKVGKDLPFRRSKTRTAQQPSEAIARLVVGSS